jgi:hypothetical protein
MTMSGDQSRVGSLRADARRRYVEMAEDVEHSAHTPLPNPRITSGAGSPPQGGREPAEQAARGEAEQEASETARSGEPATIETPLTARVRALYEDSVVPVAAIARLAGVTERAVYKWAKKFDWRPRVVRLARGTGGRFVPLADASRPVATGIMALDPQRAERTAARCVAAGLIAADAAKAAVRAARRRHAQVQAERAEAAAAREADARLREWASINRALHQAVRMREEAQGDPDRIAAAERLLAAIATQMERCLEGLESSASAACRS